MKMSFPRSVSGNPEKGMDARLKTSGMTGKRYFHYEKDKKTNHGDG